MVKLFGLNSSTSGGGKPKKVSRKRLSPSARTMEGLREKHPMYQYALNEYAQTFPVGAGIQNDDGRRGVGVVGSVIYDDDFPEDETAAGTGSEQQQQATASKSPTIPQSYHQQMPAAAPAASSTTPESISHTPQHTISKTTTTTMQQQSASSLPIPLSASQTPEVSMPTATGTPTLQNMQQEPPPRTVNSAPSLPHPQQQQHQQQHQQYSKQQYYYRPPPPQQKYASAAYTNAESAFDSYYEETYGEAYTIGGPLRYVYPSGYQSMRPRSCPWKLSIVVCVLFTWLSVFIVGHCSDQVEKRGGNYNINNNNYYQNGGNGDNNANYDYQAIDDDALAIDIRWCGSRPLYSMWVMSMLITGLSAAYCSVIGYIKMRDFAVANGRSQPPGILNSSTNGGSGDGYQNNAHGTGGGGGFGNISRSDYYVRILEQGEEELSTFQYSRPPNNGKYNSNHHHRHPYYPYTSPTGGGGGGGMRTHSSSSNYNNPLGGRTLSHDSADSSMYSYGFASSSADGRRPTIYQADGTPQFWGAHIYKPTQAAVAVTSR